MNKKLLLAGAVAMAGFFGLTAFAGKTLEQQRAEIQQSVQVKLDTYRDSMMMACEERVAMEADRRFNEAIAARAMDNTPKTAGKGTKPRPKGPKVTPLPPGKSPTQDKDDKMNKNPNTEKKDEKIMQKPNTDAKDAKMKKQQGGGN